MRGARRTRDCEYCGVACAEEWQTVCDTCRTAELMFECPCRHDERDVCECEQGCPAYGMCFAYGLPDDSMRGDPWVEAGPDD